MIDMEKVIKGLEICSEHGSWHGLNCEDNEAYKDCPYRGCETGCVVTIAKDAITLLKKQEWINVKDRLPNCNGCYLVWRPHFYPDKGMPSICYFDGSNTWHDSYGVDFTRTLAPEDVSHWKPLPEQP